MIVEMLTGAIIGFAGGFAYAIKQVNKVNNKPKLKISDEQKKKWQVMAEVNKVKTYNDEPQWWQKSEFYKNVSKLPKLPDTHDGLKPQQNKWVNDIIEEEGEVPVTVSRELRKQYKTRL